MRKSTAAIGWVFSAVFGLMLAGCTSSEPSAPAPVSEEAGTATATNATPTGMPKELVISIIPAENNEENQRSFAPMKAHLEKELGIPVRIIPVVDYAGVIEAMRGKKIDAAFFGPLSYVLAEREAGAEAFAIQVRKSGSATYHSLFIVPGDSPAKTLADLKGKRVAFVDASSTSGGLVPTLIIKKKFGVLPDQFFAKVTYAGGHDAVEMAVKNKSVDGGATDDVTYDKMVKAGKITPQTNRIINKSDPLPGAPFAYRKDLPEDLKKKIRDAFLNAHKSIDKISGDGETLRWDPATGERYEIIREMVKTLQMSQQQLLK